VTDEVETPMTDITPAPVDEAPVPAAPAQVAEAPAQVAEAPAQVAEAPAPAATVTATAPVTATATVTRTQSDGARRERPIQTVGRRKEAIVRVRILPGTGQFALNKRTIENYFPSKVHQQLVREPLVISERLESLDIFANLRGGGITGQAGALRLAIARALIELDPDLRPALKKAGFLTRDARATESKKYGLKKARKAPQYSKR
jgi:small subunit ribosomal protein S9